MKKIQKYIVAAALLAGSTLFQSCENKLDIPVEFAKSPEVAFRTVSDLQAALNSAYTGYNNTTITLNSIYTDNTKVGIDNGGQQLGLHNLVMNANNGTAANIWSSRYTAINRINRLLNAVNTGAVDISENLAEANSIIGQAYALRAFYHFELFQYFTPNYNDASGLSVPAVDFVVVDENLARNSVSEVIAFIKSDILAADAKIPSTQTDKGFVTKDFLVALEARMALFSGDYATALSKANSLIAKYPLADQNQYQNMYFDTDNSEVIFKAYRTIADARPGFIWHFGGGGPFIEMSNSLFNILDQDDIRYSVLLNTGESDPANNLHKINKYPGTAQEFLADIKVFRVSEMYLIKAEVEARSNNYLGSANTIKMLRDARFGDNTIAPAYANEAAALDYILNERRLELAFEGHRFLDLKRLNRNLERIGADCDALDNACTLSNTDARFTLPIPAGELTANPNMVQNPGY